MMMMMMTMMMMKMMMIMTSIEVPAAEELLFSGLVAVTSITSPPYVPMMMD